MFDLTDRIVLITGAAGLLGVKHAEAVLEFGATVVLSDINAERLGLAQEKLNLMFPGKKILAEPCNVADEDSIEHLKSVIFSDLGRHPDVLINNAAIDPKFDRSAETRSEPSRLENYDVLQWNKELDVGIKGSFLMIKHFGVEMARQQNGSIINVASDLGVIAPNQGLYKRDGISPDSQPVKPVTYSVVKHALLGLTKYTATYWATEGVRCNALVPGGVYNNHPEDFVQRISSLIPMGRMARQDEYKGAIVFLASGASSYVNGAQLVCDGGRTIW